MPDDLNLINLFLGFGGGEKIGTTKKGAKAFVRTKVSRRSSTSITTASSPTSPSAALKPECPAEAEVPAVLPEPDKVAAPPEPERPATTPEPEKPALAQWTDVQDALLKDLKQQGKTWKQIEEAIPSKDRGTLKERYKLLCIEQQKENVESSQEEKKDENGEAEQAGDEKGKAEAKSDNAKGAGKKSNLKESKGKPLEGSLKKVGDRPIIYLDFDDQLDAEQLAALYKLHAKAERGKWVEISSRFFDKTGKRISPEVLKEKLANC